MKFTNVQRNHMEWEVFDLIKGTLSTDYEITIPDDEKYFCVPYSDVEEVVEEIVDTVIKTLEDLDD